MFEAKGYYRLCSLSSETLRRLRPFLRRSAKTLRPLAEAMRERNPCLLRRFLFDGWNVLFMAMDIQKSLPF